MSSKDIEKKFVGQPIFKQLIDFIPHAAASFFLTRGKKSEIFPKKNETLSSANFFITLCVSDKNN